MSGNSALCSGTVSQCRWDVKFKGGSYGHQLYPFSPTCNDPVQREGYRFLISPAHLFSDLWGDLMNDKPDGWPFERHPHHRSKCR